MAKRISAWVPLTAALVASLGHGGADGTAAYAVGDCQRTCDLWRPLADQGDVGAKFDPGLLYGAGRGVARDDAAVVWDRLAANQGGSIADEVTVSTARAADGKAIQVGVTLALPIRHEVVWEVLNDYENMPRFVPDILATRLIRVGPGRKRVEIDGVARLLFLEYPTSTTLDVVYPADGSIAINSVAGNLAIHGVVRVHGDGPYTRVDYRVRITPDFWLPPLIGDFLISRQIRRQFEGMVAEMHRRADNRQTEGRSLDGLGLDGIRPGWPPQDRLVTVAWRGLRPSRERFSH
ncbi:MAG: SRPBCC family protein [Hydrogenophilales bacterium]|nr:SRPBCC family protein [Hydrogenophilales bacterium]